MDQLGLFWGRVGLGRGTLGADWECSEGLSRGILGGVVPGGGIRTRNAVEEDSEDSKKDGE